MAFGVTASGFNLPSQADILAEIQADLQAALGTGINLVPSSVLGQIAGVVAEREALVWEAMYADYVSRIPNGAEGTSVDNVLALCPGIRRLAASSTKTSATTAGVPGLVLLGTAGTVIPAGSLISVLGQPTNQFSIDADATIAAAANAVQAMLFSNVPNVGGATFSIVDTAGNELTTQTLAYSALAAQTLLTLSTTPAASSGFKLVLTQAGVVLTTLTISTLGAYPTNTAIQTAITALSGYSGVTVSGSAGSYTITWGSVANPVLTVTANTTLATITTVDSLQALLNNLLDSTAANYPLTDVQVAGSFGAGFTISFGAGTPVGSNPSSGKLAQNLLAQATSTLLNGGTQTNISVTTSSAGSPAQALASATCTVTGPVAAPANSLTVIGTPVSGWTSVNNPLAAVTGANLEGDTAAIVRRSAELQANADGPTQAIEDAVSLVSGVTQVQGFVNRSQAAQQLLAFSAVPTAGTFTITLGFPAQTTAAIAYTATAATVQTAIRLLTGYAAVLVSGSYLYGFTLDFNGSQGDQPQLAVTTVSALTAGGAVTITQSFGRRGKSFEIVVLGGDDQVVAQAIWAQQPAGIQSYGTTTKTVTDPQGNQWPVSFTRPTQIPIYVTIALTTDLLTAANPAFQVGSIPTIQQDIVDIINAVPIGGLIIGFGSGGLFGAFNGVAGITSYTMYFDVSASPAQNANIQLLNTQIAEGSTFKVIVSFT